MAKTVCKAIAFVLLAAGLSFAQGVRFGDGQPIWTVVSVTGVTNLLQGIGGAKINFCNAPANAVPCTNYATTYTDSTLTTPCATSAQVVLAGTTSCVANTDPYGNWGLWVGGGNQYEYTVTVNGISYGPYPVSLNVSSSAKVSNTGLFTGTQMNLYNQSNINSCNPTTEFHRGNNGYYATTAYSGCTAIPAGVTGNLIIGAGGMFYANSLTGGGSELGPGLPVGMLSQGTCLADNCWGWGANIIYEDDGARTTGLWGHGLEVDVGQQSPSTAYTGGNGLSGILSNLGGNGSGNLANSYAFGVGAQNAKQWGFGFFTQDGSAATGMQLGASAATGTVPSQSIVFKGLATGTPIFSNINGTGAGDIGLNPTSTGRYVIVNGNIDLIGTATLTPTPNSVVCGSDSTAGYVQKCSYNNGTFYPIPQTIASGTATFSTTAITAGSCSATVTVAATGVATTDVIGWAYNAEPTTATDAMLIMESWATSGNVNFKRCNPTAGSITPTAIVINWRVPR